jgi:hypothetical protein
MMIRQDLAGKGLRRSRETPPPGLDQSLVSFGDGLLGTGVVDDLLAVWAVAIRAATAALSRARGMTVRFSTGYARPTAEA